MRATQLGNCVWRSFAVEQFLRDATSRSWCLCEELTGAFVFVSGISGVWSSWSAKALARQHLACELVCFMHLDLPGRAGVTPSQSWFGTPNVVLVSVASPDNGTVARPSRSYFPSSRTGSHNQSSSQRSAHAVCRATKFLKTCPFTCPFSALPAHPYVLCSVAMFYSSSVIRGPSIMKPFFIR